MIRPSPSRGDRDPTPLRGYRGPCVAMSIWAFRRVLVPLDRNFKKNPSWPPYPGQARLPQKPSLGEVQGYVCFLSNALLIHGFSSRPLRFSLWFLKLEELLEMIDVVVVDVDELVEQV